MEDLGKVISDRLSENSIMAFRPQASYAELKRVKSFIDRAQTVDDLRYIAATEGSKIGYKALGRLIAGRMTPEENETSLRTKHIRG